MLKWLILSLFLLATICGAQTFNCQPRPPFTPIPKKRTTHPTYNEALVYMNLGCGGGCSGFIVGKNLIMTAAHCAVGSPYFFIHFSNNQMSTGTLVRGGHWDGNVDQDWAVIVADTGSREPLHIAKESPKEGSKGLDLTCGGEKWPAQQTLPVIFQGSKSDSDGSYTLMVEDIDHGDSGSPILNDKGEVVGVGSESVPGSPHLGKAVPLESILKALQPFLRFK